MRVVNTFLKSFGLFAILLASLSSIIFIFVSMCRKVIELFPQGGPIAVSAVLVCGLLAMFVAMRSDDKVGLKE